MQNSIPTKPLRLAYTGLSEQETLILDSILSGQDITLHKAKSDIRFWKMVSEEPFDLYLIAQNETIKNPGHLVWLLQDKISPSKLITLHTKIDEEESQRLQQYHVSHSIMRPLEQPSVLSIIEDIRTQSVNSAKGLKQGIQRLSNWASLIKRLILPHPKPSFAK